MSPLPQLASPLPARTCGSRLGKHNPSFVAGICRAGQNLGCQDKEEMLTLKCQAGKLSPRFHYWFPHGHPGNVVPGWGSCVSSSMTGFHVLAMPLGASMGKFHYQFHGYQEGNCYSLFQS